MREADRKILTLCIVHQHGKILLGMKKRGFGQGRWNGFGGKVEVGESITQAAIRECQEEAGITPQNVLHRGTLLFLFPIPQTAHEVYIFSSTSFTGTPRETVEMQPRWFSVQEIPWQKMWPDDQYWLPLLLAGKLFNGTFTFDAQETIMEYTITERDEMRISYDA